MRYDFLQPDQSRYPALGTSALLVAAMPKLAEPSDQLVAAADKRRLAVGDMRHPEAGMRHPEEDKDRPGEDKHRPGEGKLHLEVDIPGEGDMLPALGVAPLAGHRGYPDNLELPF